MKRDKQEAEPVQPKKRARVTRTEGVQRLIELVKQSPLPQPWQLQKVSRGWDVSEDVVNEWALEAQRIVTSALSDGDARVRYVTRLEVIADIASENRDWNLALKAMNLAAEIRGVKHHGNEITVKNVFTNPLDVMTPQERTFWDEHGELPPGLTLDVLEKRLGQPAG